MLLTMRDKQKIEAIQMVMDDRLTVEEGAKVLGRSARQIFRLLKKMRVEGLKGLIHGNRGRPALHRTPQRTIDRILDFVRGKYQGINDTHLREILLREEGIMLGRETLRRILRRAGIAPKRKRRRPKYRSRRPRKEAFGMMLQIDASPHDWLEGRGPWLNLVGAIDDATGKVWAHFEEAETTWAYLALMEEVLLSEGLPLSLYSDRHSIFHVLREPTIMEQLKNIKPLTQFGRAMEDLGIRIIPAYSPQAKGRVERLWETLQDRLVVELRLAKVKNKEEANAMLKPFLKNFNQRFTIPARQKISVFRSAPSLKKLDRILCLKETRVVNRDHTISFEGLILQIPPSKKFHSLAKQRVEVLQLKDGSIEIVCKNQVVAFFSKEAVTRMLETICEKSELKKAA